MIGRRRLALYGALLTTLIAVVAAIALRPTPPRTLAWHDLANVTYPTSLVRDGATLRDGLYDVPAAPGSASRVIVRLADLAAFGDLDGDAVPDAAVVLVGSGGGTGTFVELSAVHNEAGAPRPRVTTLLGDRVLVREVRIAEGRIRVRLRARGASDPLSLRTREITRQYALRGDALVLISETETEVPTAPAEDFVYRPERIELPAGGERTVTGTLQPGQIASYVVGGRAGEVLDLAVLSDFENAVLSVSGLTDATPLVSRRDYMARARIALSSDQDYAVKVVSLAGYPLPFTLQLRSGRPSASPTASPRITPAPLPSRTPAAPSVPPGAVSQRPLGDASGEALAYARNRPPTWGVAVVIPSRSIVYAENADEQVPTASIVKVLVMLTVLEQARQDHRPPSEAELALLWPMITESDNDATSQLWEDIGRGQAVASYLRGIGVAGFTPDPATSWGVSFVSARAMATTLGKLLADEILDAPSRTLALRMLDGVVPQQRWGVTAGTSSEAGDRVGLKDGWYPGEEGWRVNSVGVVRPATGAPWAIAIVTDRRATFREGIDTIEGIAAPLNAALRPKG